MRPVWIAAAFFPFALAAAQQPTPAATQLPRRPWVAGSWVEVDCSGIPPKLILRAGRSRVAFLLDTVEALEVTGTGNDDPLELPCGAHKPTPVWVEYDPPSANQRGVKGLVRAIHFEPVPSGLKTR